MDELWSQFVESLRSMDTVTAATLGAFLITEILLIVIATFLTMKALLLRRSVAVGKRLADNNLAMALVYYDAFFALWVPILRHPYISVVLRILVCFTTLAAVREFVRFYGGWRAVGVELRKSAREWLTEFVDNKTGRRRTGRVTADTRRRKAPRLNETRMLAEYAAQPKKRRTLRVYV